MPVLPPMTSKQSASKSTAARKNDKRCSKLATRNYAQSRLLSLPGELRNKICEYVIGGHEVRPTYPSRYKSPRIHVWLYDAFSHLTEESDAIWSELFNLSRVCRQLHKETALLPYKLNAFQIFYDNDFDDFLDCISPEKRNLIGTVIFGFKEEGDQPGYLMDYGASTRLHECKGLDTIIMRLMHDSNHKETVKAYAKKRGLKLIDESEYWEQYWGKPNLEWESGITDEYPEEDPDWEDILEDDY